MRGVVVKGLGGLFEVLTAEGRIVCRARGTLKRDEEKVLIGDRVELESPDGEFVVTKVEPRKNALIRPPIANLDSLYCVIAAVRPAPALETLDKLLAIAENKAIRSALVITKTDDDPVSADRYAELYRRVGYPVFLVSSVSGEGIDELRSDLSSRLASGGTAAFAGASGVGKSTLLNRLLPGVSLETGEISRRVERGRHTTRHVELFPEGGDSSRTPPASRCWILPASISSRFPNFSTRSRSFPSIGESAATPTAPTPGRDPTSAPSQGRSGTA